MLKNRKLLEEHLEKKCLKIAINPELSSKIYEYAKNKYNVNKGLTSDLICLRISFSVVSEFVLFCLLNSTEAVLKERSLLSQYFTPQEIDTYSNSVYRIETLEFPLKFKMIQVSFDQWIGVIDTNTIMQMRNAQLINYNINAQRTMQRVINNNKEVYKITLNESSIKSIHENYKRDSYIPTTLTLNIPEESDVEFHYDIETNELIIYKLDHFDITDGYHRYIAACRCYDDDNNFKYMMELRIVNFSLSKANTFIYQEDQKTKMKKLDSNSFNLNNDSNIVIEKLNQNPMFNLKGKIGKNSCLINYGELSQLINYFYFKDCSKENRNTHIISTCKKILDKFNMLTEFEEQFLIHKYDFKELFIIIYIFKEYEYLDETSMCILISKAIDNIGNLNSKKFTSKIPRKSSLSEVSKLVKECI